MKSRIRLWPLYLIGALVVFALGWVWLRGAEQLQNQVMATVGILLFGGFLILLWLLFLSRLAWKHRLKALAIGLVLIGIFLTLFELRHFTGDLIPVFAWRWAGDVTDSRQVESVDADGRLSSERDYPQFLGPDRNATLDGPVLARDWEAQPPEELWRMPVGAGWSGFAVAGDFAITLEQRDEQEWVAAYDLETGAERWATGYEARHDDPLGGLGPRSTPTIAGGQVFTLGGTGLLTSLDQATGEVLWQRDILADQGAKKPAYGVSNSPLVLGDRVVVIAGGEAGKSLAAYDRASGEPIWAGGNRRAAYSSPTYTELVGQEQILSFTQAYLSGHDADDGRMLWSWDWPKDTECTSQPVTIPGNRVFLSSGYGTGAKLFQIRAENGSWDAELIWESRGLKAKFTNVVYRDGFFYGLDDGILVSLDAETGERRWKRGRFGHGHVILVRDLLVVQAEKGHVSLVEANPEEFRELGRFDAVQGKAWNTPALAGDLLIVRNAEEAAAFRLPVVADS